MRRGKELRPRSRERLKTPLAGELAPQVLRGVLAADLVGFHTYDYARHFISSCTRLLEGVEGTPEGQRACASHVYL
jgi:hypothetical protein